MYLRACVLQNIPFSFPVEELACINVSVFVYTNTDNVCGIHDDIIYLCLHDMCTCIIGGDLERLWHHDWAGGRLPVMREKVDIVDSGVLCGGQAGWPQQVM